MSRAEIGRLLTEGLVEAGTLPDFFARASQWEVEFALESISTDSKVRYVNPHAYSSDITAVRADKEEHIPDIRYLPYILRAHLDFLERLPEAVRSGGAVSLSDVSNGVNDLYEFLGRVLAFHSRVHQPVDFTIAYNEIERLAHDLSPQFADKLAEFKSNPTLLNKSVDQKRDEGVPPYSAGDRRNEVRGYGARGRRRGKGANLKLRGEVKGEQD